MYSFTPEEAVFAAQLADIRKRQAQLEIDERTHVDRLSTILRAHGDTMGDAQVDGRLYTVAALDGYLEVIDEEVPRANPRIHARLALEP